MILRLIIALLKEHKHCKVHPKDFESAMKVIGKTLYQENQNDSCAFYKKLFAIGKRACEKK